MYSYKVINGTGCVIHDATGCSLPYHSKASKYTLAELLPHSFKLDVFEEWFNYSNSEKKKIKHMKPSEAIQFLSLGTVTGTKYSKNNISLESCNKATPAAATTTWKTKESEFIDVVFGCKQEGTTPMCYEKTGKSEAEISRAYLTGRLGDANYAKRDQLRRLFNLDAIAIPKTYKELIDAIKNGKYEIDAKVAKRIEISTEDEGQYYGSPLDGITFTDFPKPDYEGFNAASTEQQKKYTQTKDALFLPYEQGLKALADFEAWMPEGK